MKFSSLTRKCIWKLELTHDMKRGREERKRELKCIILPSICLSVIIRKSLYQKQSCKMPRGWNFIVPINVLVSFYKAGLVEVSDLSSIPGLDSVVQ